MQIGSNGTPSLAGGKKEKRVVFMDLIIYSPHKVKWALKESEFCTVKHMNTELYHWKWLQEQVLYLFWSKDTKIEVGGKGIFF